MSLRLAVPAKAGEALVHARGLCVEARGDLEQPTLAAVRGHVTSVHAPAMLSAACEGPEAEVRLHLASVAPEFRRRSVRLITDHIEAAHRLFPRLEVVVTHAAPHRFPHPPVRPAPGEPRSPLRPELARWEHLVDSVRHIALHSARLGLVLAVENNWAYWDGIAPDAPVQELDAEDFLEYYCSSPEEWLRLAEEVGEPNVCCCLDPSHAVPYCHRQADEADRRRVLAEFIARPGRIGHFHWNDSDIVGDRGRNDLHLPLGEGNLGREFHAAVKRRALELGRPVLLEHFRDAETLEREIAYIAALGEGG